MDDDKQRYPRKEIAMLRGIYDVAYAMEMATRNHEIVSENLVHATTPGYRRQGLLYEATAARVPPATVGEVMPPPAPPRESNSPTSAAFSGMSASPSRRAAVVPSSVLIVANRIARL